MRSVTRWRRSGSRFGWLPLGLAAALSRPLHGRRHAAGGLGLAQELPPARRASSARGRRAQPGCGLLRSAAPPRDACIDARSRGAAPPQGQAACREALLSGPPPHREPAGAGCRRGTTRATSSVRRRLGVTPHVVQNQRGPGNAIDGPTTRHEGYRQRQRRPKLVEEVFG